MAYYSKKHYQRVSNAGTGNPQLTNEEKCKVWAKLAEEMRQAGHMEAVKACEDLIKEHQENNNKK